MLYRNKYDLNQQIAFGFKGDTGWSVPIVNCYKLENFVS